MQHLTMLDPTSELSSVIRKPIARPTTLDGLTIGLLDISKARGNVLLDRVELHLKRRGLATKRYMKPTFSRPAPDALQQKIATECDVVIEALADWGSCTSCSVHDINNLDQRGVPGVFIASTEFVNAAETQANALGFAPASVFIQHPIQDRTDKEVQALADDALEAIMATICQTSCSDLTRAKEIPYFL